MCLNGDGWQFCIDSLDSGVTKGYQLSLPGGEMVKVPHTWNVDPALEFYTGTAWYRKKFSILPEWIGNRIILRFNAVSRDVVVYLNGKEVARHFNSAYTQFYVDISRYASVGENILALSVNNAYSETALPYNASFDWANDGGIIRDVYLMVLPEIAVRYMHIDASIDGNTIVKMKLWEDRGDSIRVALNIDRFKGRRVFSDRKAVFRKSVDGEYTYSFLLEDPELWHFDAPNLYVASVKISEGKDSDEFSQRYGYRSISLNGRVLELNGEPVRLPGCEWMPGSNPDYGMAEPREYSYSCLRLLKESNSVITRFHWQQDPSVLDWADENGLLVQVEIPWWQRPASIGGEVFRTAERQIAETVIADYNHPCVFAWAISNEVNGQNPEEAKRLIGHVRKYDSVRFVNIVNNRLFSRLDKDPSMVGSIPTWNEYIGTWHGQSRDQLPFFLDRIECHLGDRPLLITECGLCEPRFSGGDSTRISDMKYHYGQWASKNWIVGTIYFSLNDYRTHKGETGEGRFRQRWHGVVDVFNRPKESYYVLKGLQSPLYVESVSDYMIFLKNKDSLPSYAVCGYYLRTDSGETVYVPDMDPGDTAVLKVKKRFTSFEIFRPTGFSVLSWNSDKSSGR